MGCGVMESLQRLNKLVSYVEENLGGEIDNQTLSRIAACPLAVLQRLFVLITGATLTEYIRLRRLARAADEVRSTNEKVIDIAIKYGYDSSDTFCVAFKRRYGMMPTAARTQTRFFLNMTASPLRHQSNVSKEM
jgi:AraC family transcriptional regulator